MVSANVILRSVSGRPVEAGPSLTHRTVREFLPTEKTLERARNHLTELGFRVDLVAPTHITISGHADLFQEVFGVRLTQKHSPFIKTAEARAKHPYYVSTVHPTIPRHLANVIEAVTFPGPIKYHTAAFPPPVPYYHLKVPNELDHHMDALRAHAHGITGTGVELAIVDTGFMTPWHPYYVGRGYQIRPVVSDPNDTEPDDDSSGHGTAVAACALAVAPGVSLTLYKGYSHNNAAAFSRAAAQQPHIISCSWESPSYDPALHLAVNLAVAEGVVVLFACGNEGPVGWPGCEPAVMSVGGVYVDSHGCCEASDYASSGVNPIAPGRQCPDFCGIDGRAQHHGRLIMLPTQPGSAGDVKGSTVGEDETAPDDGWVVESGTSSATPMVAGVAALLMQADPSTLGQPDAVKARLAGSCRDVTKGESASGQAAGPGADDATGAGLVQGYRAIRPFVERPRRRRSHEGGYGPMAAKGREVRTWLLMRVDDPLEAAQQVLGLALEQQWSADWSIKRVDTIDHVQSCRLGKFPASDPGFNLMVAVKAANETELEVAFLKIENLTKPTRVEAPHGHVVTSSVYLDWN